MILRSGILICCSLIAAVAIGVVAVRADHAPVLVVPGRSDVPVVINGRNAAWAVVEGDWGLYRPGHMAPTVIGGAARRDIAAPRVPYFPRYGTPPERGRFEVEPPPDRILPEPAESFYRSWSSPRQRERVSEERRADGPTPEVRSFQRTPGDVPAALDQPLSANPPIIVVPQLQRRRP